MRYSLTILKVGLEEVCLTVCRERFACTRSKEEQHPAPICTRRRSTSSWQQWSFLADRYLISCIQVTKEIQNVRGLCVLTTNPDLPVVPQPPVTPDLLEPLEVITELLVDLVGKDVGVLAVDHVLLPVQEPSGDLELGGVLHDGDYAFELVRVEFSGAVDQYEA